MTAVSESDKSASDPRTTGLLTRMMSKALGRMTADERTDMMQDAATLTSTQLNKAEEALAKTDNMSAVDSAHAGFIEDHWSDKPQDVISVNPTGGPGSSTPSGSIGVGPSQEASGNGGPRMEAHYSRHAPQNAFMTAAEKLGREISGIRGSMKSMIETMKGFTTQIEVMKASATVLPDVQPLIDAAVAKAIAPVRAELHKALTVAKAEKDDGEDDEEAKAAALLAKADDKEWKKEKKDEDDDESESAKSAAELRVMAKSRVTSARLRIAKALDYVAEEKPKAAQRAMSLAKINLAKAKTLLDEATALRDGKTGLSTQSIALDIAKATKGAITSEAGNQDVWPATTDKEADFGKAQPVAETAKAPEQAAPPAANPDLAKAIAQIEAAANGMGMMTASVGDLFKVLSGQSKPVQVTGPDGERHNMPPVFALAKAGASDLATREAELTQLRDANVISFEDHDRARDALTRVRMGLPEETIKAMVDRLPDAARAVLTRSAA